MEKMESESERKARMIPKPVWFILSYGLLERYCLYGMTAILALFLHHKLNLEQSTATAVYHYFFFASYGFGIFGAIIADTYLGRFKTLLYGMTGLSAIGSIFLAVGTVDYWDYLLVPFTATALVLISFGWGCFEPNLPAFAGDQYVLPLEAKGFSLCFGFLFVIQSIARIIGAVTSPLIRSNTKCFGSDECYTLLFGIFVIVKVFAVTILLVGRKSTVILKPRGNMLVKFCNCIGHAIRAKFSDKSESKKAHWLDYSIDAYGAHMVADVRRLLSLLYLFPSGILVSSLFFQQASRWVFQSQQMNGKLGNFEIKPDQVPAINALAVIIFVFVCEFYLIPFLRRIGLVKNHLHAVALGGVVSATSFVFAAILQFQVEKHFLHMAWQIPQHILLALGEVLVYVQITQFFYTQAPVQMRSVMQAVFSLVMGAGNLIVALIASVKLFDSMAYEFLLFAGIVYVAMAVFLAYAGKYKYVEPQTVDYAKDDE